VGSRHLLFLEWVNGDSLDRNHRMEIEYDGTGLHGWAKQEGLATVEGSLEAALRTVLGHAPALRVAGRTDAGVHARRQVVSLRLPATADLSRLMASLNALTPPGVAVTRIARCPEGFDARRHATSRTYRYFISTAGVVSPFWSRYCWHVGHGLDGGALRAAAAAVEGRHDFAAFTPTETEHVYFERVVLRCRWQWARGGFPCGAGSVPRVARVGAGRGMLCLEIEADAFLRHMVRVLVGTMVDMAEGARDLDGFRLLLRGAPREAAGPTAPAHGLFLWDVAYRPGAHAGITEESE